MRIAGENHHGSDPAKRSGEKKGERYPSASYGTPKTGCQTSAENSE